AETALRCCLDPVGTGAEIDAVEIELENLPLGELVVEQQSQHEFLNVAVERARLGQEQILRQLLGESRAALRHVATKEVGDHRTPDADRVDSAMLIEAAILDGDERARQVGGKLLERQ